MAVIRPKYDRRRHSECKKETLHGGERDTLSCNPPPDYEVIAWWDDKILAAHISQWDESICPPLNSGDRRYSDVFYWVHCRLTGSSLSVGISIDRPLHEWKPPLSQRAKGAAQGVWMSQCWICVKSILMIYPPPPPPHPRTGRYFMPLSQSSHGSGLQCVHCAPTDKDLQQHVFAYYPHSSKHSWSSDTFGPF